LTADSVAIDSRLRKHHQVGSVHDLVIRSACPWRAGPGGQVDVAIDGGYISEVSAKIAAHGREEWDVGGRLLLPALVDPHLHLDKAFLARELGGAASLSEARERFARLRSRLSRANHIARGGRLINRAIHYGVGALRTHADVDAVVGLRHVEAALELRSTYSDRIAIQVVAFIPAHVALEDRASWQKLEEALRLGCDAVGGTTGARGSEGSEFMRRVVALAEHHGCMVDVHLDETLDSAVQNLAGLATLTIERGLQGRVVASHCCSLSVAPPARRAEAIRRAAEAGIHVIALPLTNLYLQGRESGLRGLPPVTELLAAGVNVACGSDNVQDSFFPAGNADPLFAAQVLGIAAQLADSRYLFEAVTLRAARAIGLSAEPDWCRAGAAACFSVADCGAEDDPVSSLPSRPLTVYHGRVVRRPGDTVHSMPAIRRRM
jgi:cytosine deaminase